MSRTLSIFRGRPFRNLRELLDLTGNQRWLFLSYRSLETCVMGTTLNRVLESTIVLGRNAPVGGRSPFQPVRQFPVAGVVDDVLTDQLPDNLGWRQVVSCADFFEDLLLARVDENGEASRTVFHVITLNVN